MTKYKTINGIQIPDLSMNFLNLKHQIENFNFIEENPMMNITDDNKNEYVISKYNIFIVNAQGGQVLLVLDPDITVKEMLKTYLMKIKKPELFGKIDKISFLFNAERLIFEDSRKIKELFKYTPNYNILVFM